MTTLGKSGGCLALAATVALRLLATRAEAADMSRPAAWAIGHNLSLAALLYNQGAAQETVDKWFAKAKVAADAAGVYIRPLPPNGKASSEAGTVIRDLMKGNGWAPTGKQLQKKYGREQADLFMLAIISNLDILLYQPGGDSGLADALKSRSEAVRLPPPLWMPVVVAMDHKEAQDDVNRAIFKMHDDVATELMKDPK